MGIDIGGIEGIPDAPAMLGMEGIPGDDSIPDCACGPTPGGSAGIFGIGGMLGAPDIFGMTGREGIGGMAGVACGCGPTPGGNAGMLGMVGIGGAAGAGCGPLPGGKPPGGIGIPGIPGAPPVAASVSGFKCTKLRLFGKSKVSVPELMSRMSTGLGQLVAVISTRNEVVPTVYSNALVSLP